jgi:site-specific recombinase XerD
MAGSGLTLAASDIRPKFPQDYRDPEKVREVPLHPALRAVLADWLAERGDWPGAHGAALFLNQRGGRLSARGTSDIITAIATDAHLDGEGVSAHPLRHTFITSFRGGTDLVTVAELAGHARLETTRAYSLPTDEDKTKALNLLITDQ